MLLFSSMVTPVFGLDPPVEYSVNHYTAKDNNL
jgi:hypothetical protein